MHIISSSQSLDAGASNLRVILASIISDLADRIINVETGKRHYIGGVKVSDPEPMFTSDLNYCKINMRVYEADLNILLPAAMVNIIEANVIKSLINELGIELTRRDVELGQNMYMASDMTFALTECEFAPASNAFLTNHKSIHMTKRVFMYSPAVRNKGDGDKTAFIWHIHTAFKYRLHHDNLWLNDNVDTYINFIGANLDGMTYDMLYNLKSIIARYTDEKIIEYSRTCHILDSGEPYRRVEEKYLGEINDINDFKMNNMSYERFLAHSASFINVARDTSQSILTGQEFLVEFGKNNYSVWHDSVLNPVTQCQMCTRRTFAKFYIVKRMLDDRSSIFAMICDRCLKRDPACIELSRTYDMYAVKTDNPTDKFSRVSADYGIPPSHIELFMCKNFDKHGFARDDNTIAFRYFQEYYLQINIFRFIETIEEYFTDINARGGKPNVIVLV